ncbi:MAG: haloacid dehalogenase [Candidatus Hydrothermarchaeota archaeon]|nr:MAG: haloacid dehalogenase [Candidatus Hydrothermarchaeota archaeon]
MVLAVFFDIDDTLYDSTKLTTTARRNSIRAMIDAGLKGDEDEIFEILQKIIKKYGSNYPKHYDELLKELGLPWNPKIIAAGVVAYEHTKAGFLKPFPGVVPTLLKLKNKYKLGVISNGLAVKQWEKLVALGLHHFFEVVVTSQEVGYEKPQKEIFEIAIKKLKLKPEQCVMVGDRLDIDIAGAKLAGMKTIRIKKGKYAKMKPSKEDEKPDYEIKEFEELLDIL